MAQPKSETVELAAHLRTSFAGDNLTPLVAKLYSQYTRLKEGQPGLTGWGDDEARLSLNDAIRLLEAAFIERDSGNEEWYRSARRAGEVLEWLSNPKLSPFHLPTHLFSAAAYQLAGYPARAYGLLKLTPDRPDESRILRLLLAGNFRKLFSTLVIFWEKQNGELEQRERDFSWSDEEELLPELNQWIVNELASALGVLCAHMRWGGEPRTESALDKLDALGKLMLHSVDPYSWLLAKLCAEVAKVIVDNSLRKQLEGLSKSLSSSGHFVLERYMRLYFQLGKTQTWPSQLHGIKRLTEDGSFVLCTPTGSGKTTVAEIAILQSLFPDTPDDSQNENTDFAPIVIYLVPSRALAAEVEGNLSHVLRHIGGQTNITVTGLYGGTDWGPTDAWLTSTGKTVLICTYEKAEALLLFLGPPFLSRVSLVIIDEAHFVQFDGKLEDLENAENRSLRLEVLGTRLLSHISGRFIALSAMATHIKQPLAGWVARDPTANPVANSYRSTRQLIGRLECLQNRGFEIQYDFLDGADLAFGEGRKTDRHCIPDPFPPHPPAKDFESQGPEKRLRPHLFWAALHLASPDDSGRQRAVLISITQHIRGYAKDLVTLFDKIWANVDLPILFTPPTDETKKDLWEKCLLTCEDYFTNESWEYRLLEKGVIVHHGRMPGSLARSLLMVIKKRIINLVLATSTLTEGVNLPFETILIPSLHRWRGDMSVSEFGNLVGRAGRPGYGTEGRTLVLLSQIKDMGARQARQRYMSRVKGLRNTAEESDEVNEELSPIATLITRLERLWQEITSAKSTEGFLTWLEQTAPVEIDFDGLDESAKQRTQSLDTLDGVLLAAITELEQLASAELSDNDLEEQLRHIWGRTFAYFASQETSRCEDIFVRRGLAIRRSIFPDQHHRRRLYRTSLPPRDGTFLLTAYSSIRKHLSLGEQYADWPSDQRFVYIKAVIELFNRLTKFQVKSYPGRSQKKPEWHEILLWWLNPGSASRAPTPAQISEWHSYVNSNFYYRFNWGLGCLISLAIDEAFGDEDAYTPTLDIWPRTELPWIVFWIKELIVWGTLEPVAAYLLARNVFVSRPEAEAAARKYYEHQAEGQTANELLDAISIRDWVGEYHPQEKASATPTLEVFDVNLLRDFTSNSKRRWRVLPVEFGEGIRWVDPAGFPLAQSQKPDNWKPKYRDSHDFELDAIDRRVYSELYIDL